MAAYTRFSFSYEFERVSLSNHINLGYGVVIFFVAGRHAIYMHGMDGWDVSCIRYISCKRYMGVGDKWQKSLTLEWLEASSVCVLCVVVVSYIVWLRAPVLLYAQIWLRRLRARATASGVFENVFLVINCRRVFICRVRSAWRHTLFSRCLFNIVVYTVYLSMEENAIKVVFL